MSHRSVLDLSCQEAFPLRLLQPDHQQLVLEQSPLTEHSLAPLPCARQHPALGRRIQEEEEEEEEERGGRGVG